MRSINEWYDDHGYAVDLQPGRDWRDDEQPDPRQHQGVLSEVPLHVVRVGSGRSAAPGGKRAGSARSSGSRTWQAAVRKWLADHPGSSYQACAAAITGKGRFTVTRKMVSNEMKRELPVPRQSKAAKPAKPVKAGKGNTPTRVKPTAQPSKQTKSATKSRRVKRVRKYGTVAPLDNPSPHRRVPLPRADQVATRIVRCESCDMVVTANGGCRC